MFPPPNKTSNFIRFLAYVKPYWRGLVLGTFGGIVKFTLPLMIPMVIRHLIDEVFPSDQPVAEKWHEVLWIAGGMIVLFIFVWAPWTYVRHYFAGKVGTRSVFDLRCDLYYRILRMSSSFFDRNKSGGIVSRLISDIAQAQNLIGTALTNVWMDAAAVVAVLWLLMRIDPATMVVALVTFPLYLFFFKKLGREIRNQSYQVQKETADMSENVNEKVMGSVVVHAFTQEKNEEERFNQDSEQLFSTALRRVHLQSLNIMITNTLIHVAPLIVYIYGGWRILQERMSIGDLVAIGMLMQPLYMPLQRFSELNIVFANAMASLDRIFEVLDEEPEIRSRPDAHPLDLVRGEVWFDHVHFAYHREEWVLRDVDFQIEPGMRVALVGQSGSGKSTIARLIPRLYDTTKGTVRIDGRDVRTLKLKSLRSKIGMVLQDPILFSGTIRENILYGQPHASQDQIVEACRQANALEFIVGLPDGFDTEVGERGNFLSGGQKQRITIARAFLKDPAILILDEPTSALDSVSEQMIQSALDRLMNGRTTFIIAHRLSTITSSDLILVLEQGVVVERGTHEYLLSHGKVYRNYCMQQFKSAGKMWEIGKDVLDPTEMLD